MLASHQRLRDADSFRRVLRRGRRAATQTIVVSALVAADHTAAVGSQPMSCGASRAGLIVSRAVGNAVARNLVKRRLRHLLREALPALPAGTELTVRALPPAAAASSAELRRDLDRCLSRATRRSAAA